MNSGSARAPAGVFAKIATLAAHLLLWVGSPHLLAASEFDPAAVAKPAWQVYRDRDGLPQNTVQAITFDAQGRLWIGTQDGAAWSAGRGWHVVNMPGRMESNFVRAILAANDGSLWFGTQAGGLYRLVQEVWEDHSPPCPHPAGFRVTALTETLDPPALWVATHGCGVARWSAGAWEIYGVEHGLPSELVWGLHASPSDGSGPASLWVGTEKGVAVLAPGSTRFTVEPALARVSANSFLARQTAEGDELWVGTYGAGVFRRRAGHWSAITEGDGLPSLFVTSLASHGGSGPVWVGTDGGGLAAMTEGGITVVDTEAGLPSNAIYALAAAGWDKGGKALWIGTRSGGLVRMMPERWRSLLPPSDAAHQPVTAILLEAGSSSSPVAWFGMDGGGLARLDRRGWTRFFEREGELPSNAVQCLLATRDEQHRPVLWVGTRHGGLARLSGGKWQIFNQRSGALPSDMVQVLAATRGEDDSPQVWVGTREGLAVHRQNRWESNPAGLELPHPSVQALLETQDTSGARVLWIGTGGGLVRYSAGITSPVDVALHNRSVQSLQLIATPDGRRELWIGTDGGGVARLDLSSATRELPPLTDESSPPLPNNVIYQILQDGDGKVYLLTNRGVARLRWRPDSSDEFEVITFTVDDGLVANQGNRGAGVVDWHGRIWFGTVGGASIYDPAAEEVDRTSKPLLLNAWCTNNERDLIASGARLPWYRAQLVLEASLVSFFRPGDTRYRAQLQPLEAEPSAWSSEYRWGVGPLPGGSYTFRVWGRDWAGNVTGPKELRFQVILPPWRRWWAVALYVLVAAGVVAAVMAIRSRAHHRREQALQALIAARTRELSDANELLREMSYLDPVTEIANRRRFDDRLDHEWRRAIRTGSAISLILVDIDFFKEFNDTFGHQRGDECLHAIAHALADGLPRAGDSVARYGGEEFAVILPLTERAGASKLAEALRQRVEALGIAHPASTAAQVVTISCGVATLWPTAEIEPAELVRLADESLYVAKRSGRNRTAAQHGAPRSSVSNPAVPPPPS